MNIKNNKIFNLLRKIKYYWYPKAGNLQYYLESLNNKGSISFIEIGANLTDRNDHIARFLDKKNWHGILIEPQKYVFQSLKEKYKNNTRVKSLNVAISENNEIKNLYRFNFSNETWVTSLSSFSKHQLLKHFNHGWIKAKAQDKGLLLSNNPEEYIDFEEVKCLNFNTLIEQQKIKQIDLLVIDTEGYDAKIIRMIDFNIIKPQMIIFEHRHLKISEYKKVLNYLKKLDYKVIFENGDTLAYLK